ncbi:GIY-YIG nuclease family protein [Listeria kieliensis]
MDAKRKKELLQQYKEMKTYYGVIQLKNDQNGKIFIDTVPNLKNRWSYYVMSLDSNRHPNKQLQEEWNAFGKEHFNYQVLFEKPNTDVTDMKFELKQLKKKWLEKLQPFGQQGYHKIEELNK